MGSIPLMGSGFQAAEFNRINADWRYWDRDPTIDWVVDARRLAARGWDLVRNDSTIAALVGAKISGTHGAKGLKFRSLYDENGENTTTDAESAKRREIEEIIDQVSYGTQLDASSLMTRQEFEEAVDTMATVSGECFAVRAFLPDRPRADYGTCWRLIRPERVLNPPGVLDSPSLYQGIELDPDGAPVALWVGPPRTIGQYNSMNPKDWTRVPWFDDDGAYNVIHRIGLRYPGSIRALSMLTPIMFLAKQTKGVLDAYVIGKRIQACHPGFLKCDNPVEAARKDKNGAVYGPNTTYEPGKMYYIGRDADIVFPTWGFNGADMKDFLDTLKRDQFAAWGMPIDVVLAQLGETNMAASRSAWQQYYRQCERWQDDHIEQVSRILDESIVREAVARGDLSVNTSLSWNKIMAGRYVRPPRAMPDPLKEAQAVELWSNLGRDLTGLWGESGVDFRESIMQRAEDDQLMDDQGVGPKADAEAAAALTIPADEVEPVDGKKDAPPAASASLEPTTININVDAVQPAPIVVNEAAAPVPAPKPAKPVSFEVVRDARGRITGVNPVAAKVK